MEERKRDGESILDAEEERHYDVCPEYRQTQDSHSRYRIVIYLCASYAVPLLIQDSIVSNGYKMTVNVENWSVRTISLDMSGWMFPLSCPVVDLDGISFQTDCWWSLKVVCAVQGIQNQLSGLIGLIALAGIPDAKNRNGHVHTVLSVFPLSSLDLSFGFLESIGSCASAIGIPSM